MCGEVNVKDLVFSYPNRPNVHVANRLTLHADPGETIALVGESGGKVLFMRRIFLGGKSTIISLLQRYYNPKSGELSIDRVPIRKFTLSFLRQETALVGQEPVLFSGTIYDNICLGVPDAKRSDVVEACHIANATRFIERLPEVGFCKTFDVHAVFLTTIGNFKIVKFLK